MTKKKNRLFTFFCSLIPGAGEMYLGFFKHGISVMSLFFLLLFCSGILFPPLMFLSPVLWFYSFFHVNHLITLPDEEFYMIEDDYCFHLDVLVKNRSLLFTRYRKATSCTLIFLGAVMLWRIFSDFIQTFLGRYLVIPEPVTDLLFWFSRRIPQLSVAAGIIFLGIWLIRKKKTDLFLTDGNGGGISGESDTRR